MREGHELRHVAGAAFVVGNAVELAKEPFDVPIVARIGPANRADVRRAVRPGARDKASLHQHRHFVVNDSASEPRLRARVFVERLARLFGIVGRERLDVPFGKSTRSSLPSLPLLVEASATFIRPSGQPRRLRGPQLRHDLAPDRPERQVELDAHLAAVLFVLELDAIDSRPPLLERLEQRPRRLIRAGCSPRAHARRAASAGARHLPPSAAARARRARCP